MQEGKKPCADWNCDRWIENPRRYNIKTTGPSNDEFVRKPSRVRPDVSRCATGPIQRVPPRGLESDMCTSAGTADARGEPIGVAGRPLSYVLRSTYSANVSLALATGGSVAD